MIKTVRVLTFIAAIIAVMLAIFHVNPERELKVAYKMLSYSDYDQALRHARRAYFFSQDSRLKQEAMLLATDLSLYLNRYDVAVSFASKAISANQACIKCYLKRSLANYMVGNYKASKNDLEKLDEALKMPPVKKSYYLSLKGFTQMKLGKLKEAETSAHYALELFARNPLAHLLLAKIYKGEKETLSQREYEETFTLGTKSLTFMRSIFGKIWKQELSFIPTN